jgi:hypothetical protein
MERLTPYFMRQVVIEKLMPAPRVDASSSMSLSSFAGTRQVLQDAGKGGDIILPPTSR